MTYNGLIGVSKPYSLTRTQWSNELRWGPRGPGPPERPGSPRETSVLRGFKGACKRPWNSKMITHYL